MNKVSEDQQGKEENLDHKAKEVHLEAQDLMVHQGHVEDQVLQDSRAQEVSLVK